MHTRPALPTARADTPSDGGNAAEFPQAPDAMLLAHEQMLVNEALVKRIFQREREDAALRASEEKLNELVAHQIQLREAERKRVAREIHDSLGQNLLALRMDVATLHQYTSEGHPRLHGWVGRALENLDVTLRSVRSIIDELRPFELELGIEAAVEHELKQFRRFSGIECEFFMDERVRSVNLTDEQTLALYRALQESVGNCARHARASRIEIFLRLMRSGVSMVISDDGVGIPAGKQRGASSLGLLAIRTQVAALGGRLDIKSVRTHGTVVSVFLPLDQ